MIFLFNKQLKKNKKEHIKVILFFNKYKLFFINKYFIFYFIFYFIDNKYIFFSFLSKNNFFFNKFNIFANDKKYKFFLKNKNQSEFTLYKSIGNNFLHKFNTSNLNTIRNFFKIKVSTIFLNLYYNANFYNKKTLHLIFNKSVNLVICTKLNLFFLKNYKLKNYALNNLISIKVKKLGFGDVNINFSKLNFFLFFKFRFIIYLNKTQINYNSFLVFFKKKFNFKELNPLFNFLNNINDFYFLNNNKNTNNGYISNKHSFFLKTYEISLGYSNFYNNIFTNYYPIMLLKKKNNFIFENKFNDNYNKNYSIFLNKVIISFLEKLFKKNFFIKVINNSFYETNNWYLNSILTEYKFYKPVFFKNSLISDFVKIVWYSFFFKDISLLSKWITVFMESLNFKNHKKFLLFFNNFLKKYSLVFIDILKIKGFFFDIRGKVGVTGSSKKRHVTIKFGVLNKFNKKNKIDFDQKLVRTYSGVMGLTYIINY